MWSGRASSYLDRAIGAIALTVVFAVAGAGALPLHADLPAPRRLIVEVVNRLLAVPFGGRVRIGHVDRLSVSGIAGASLDVFDPTGETVLHADGVRARVRTAALLRSVVARDGPLVIELPVVAIDHVETNLDAGAEHRLRLAEAFSTRPSASHAAPTPPGARSVRVEVADVRVRHAWMHGAPPGAPPLDVDVFELSGGLRVEPEATRVDVVRAEIVSGGAPRALDPRGVVEGSLTTPSSGGEGVDVRARFDGDLGGLATNAALDLRGRQLDQAEPVADRGRPVGLQHHADLVAGRVPPRPGLEDPPGALHLQVGVQGQRLVGVDAGEQVLAARDGLDHGRAGQVGGRVLRDPEVAAGQHPAVERPRQPPGGTADRVALRHRRAS